MSFNSNLTTSITRVIGSSRVSSNQRKCVAPHLGSISLALRKKKRKKKRTKGSELRRSIPLSAQSREKVRGKSRERTELCHCCLPSNWPMSQSAETFNRRSGSAVSASLPHPQNDEVTAPLLHGSATLIPRIGANFTKTPFVLSRN